MEKVVCPKCGASEFKVLMEQVIRDVTNNRRVNRGFEYTDATIDGEKIFEVVCLKCGERLVQRCVRKPISKKAWDDFWDEYVANYIIGFEHYAANCEGEPEYPEDWILRGMVKGMWAIYNLIESEMVEK